MKKRIKYTGAFLALTILGIIISCSESSDSVQENSNPGSSSNSGSGSNCPTKTCADFATQSQAQATYNSNKACYKNLDRDGNGKACESLPK